MTAKAALDLFKAAGSKWSDYNAPRLGAALAYYTLLSLAPLLILLVTGSALVFNQTTAERDLLIEVRNLVGFSEAQTIKAFLDSAHHVASGAVATSVALLTLLFGASGVFVELRDSLNLIWDAPKPKSSAWRAMIAQRLIAFLMILGFSILLVASLILTTAVMLIKKSFGGLAGFHTALLSDIGSYAVSLLALVVLFALIFKFVPAVRIRWRDVIAGAVLTAILFEIGKALLAFYIGTAAVGSAYGAAGSLIVLVVWVYYSAQIFFFGASFTRVYADTYGSHAGARARKAKLR
ncbi:MAG TPA: YihY/virulence factor BrkB family protein [Bryobacteraceae bacterium]|nr:YihY/virulence factor BrkB family protein [Bryobacteraceae bacterium]